MLQQHWKAFRGLLKVGEWTVESAFLELKQIKGSHSSVNKKKQALKMKKNATAYVAFWKKNNPVANPNQQGNVVPGVGAHSLVVNSTMSNPGGASSNPSFSIL